jgi:hypothetical protein
MNKYLTEAMGCEVYAQSENKDTPLHHFSSSGIKNRTFFKNQIMNHNDGWI